MPADEDEEHDILINPRDEKRMKSDAEFFFGNYSRAFRENKIKQSMAGGLDVPRESFHYDSEFPTNTFWQRIYKFYRVKVVGDVYPPYCDTNEKILEEYLARRTSPKYKVGKWHLVAMGIAAVISGEFAGWNYGLLYAGYNGYWIANALALAMYVCLALCLAEMACAIPLIGGPSAFVTCALGRLPGFVLGISEALSYNTFLCLLAYAITLLISEQTGLSSSWWPLLWLFILGIPYYFLCYRPKWNWAIVSVLVAICLIQIVIFLLFTMNIADLKWLQVGWDKSVTQDIYYGKALVGVFQGVFTSAWWFTGFECLTHGIKETTIPKKNLPFSLITSCIILGLCGFFLTYFNVLVPPGAGIIAKSFYPMVDVISAVAGDQYHKVSILLMYPSLVVNICGMMWCASRQCWALSRVGFYPQSLSISSKEGGVPIRGAFFACAQVYVFLLFALLHRETTQTEHANELFLDATLVCALITYFFISLTYIGFTFYFPDAPRPFKNPFGVYGAGYVSFISASTVMIKVATNLSARYALLVWAVYVVIWGFYFVGYRRLHLVPNEDAVLAGFFRSFKFRPEMYA